MIDDNRQDARFYGRKNAQRDELLRRARPNVKILQRPGVELEMGIKFLDHVVLAHLREEGCDLALPEGVIDGVVDCLDTDSEARGGRAVDHKRSAGRLGLRV